MLNKISSVISYQFPVFNEVVNTFCVLLIEKWNVYQLHISKFFKAFSMFCIFLKKKKKK